MSISVGGNFVRKSGDTMTGPLTMGLNPIFLTDGSTGGAIKGNNSSTSKIDIRNKDDSSRGSLIISELSMSNALTISAGKLIDGVDVSAIPKAFGTPVARSPSTVYQAATDGFVMLLDGSGSDHPQGDFDGSNPPTTIRQRATNGANGACFIMPVLSGQYYDMVYGTAIWWIPIEP